MHFENHSTEIQNFCSLSLIFQTTVIQPWFRYWLGLKQELVITWNILAQISEAYVHHLTSMLGLNCAQFHQVKKRDCYHQEMQIEKKDVIADAIWNASGHSTVSLITWGLQVQIKSLVLSIDGLCVVKQSTWLVLSPHRGSTMWIGLPWDFTVMTKSDILCSMFCQFVQEPSTPSWLILWPCPRFWKVLEIVCPNLLLPLTMTNNFHGQNFEKTDEEVIQFVWAMYHSCWEMGRDLLNWKKLLLIFSCPFFWLEYIEK